LASRLFLQLLGESTLAAGNIILLIVGAFVHFFFPAPPLNYLSSALTGRPKMLWCGGVLICPVRQNPPCVPPFRPQGFMLPANSWPVFAKLSSSTAFSFSCVTPTTPPLGCWWLSFPTRHLARKFFSGTRSAIPLSCFTFFATLAIHESSRGDLFRLPSDQSGPLPPFCLLNPPKLTNLVTLTLCSLSPRTPRGIFFPS